MNTNYLRELAEDLHSSTGYNPIAAALSLAADEIERIRSNAAALEDEKNTYMDYVGDALAQDDNETLWDAAQRVLSDRDRLRAELTEVRNPDCRTCVSYGPHAGCPLARNGCVEGSMYVARWSEPTPVRLYEIDAAMAGGEK